MSESSTNVVPIGLARPAQEPEVEQVELFEVPQERWRELWWDMPSFTNDNAKSIYRIVVNIMCYEDLVEFAQRLGMRVTRNTKVITFPEENLDAPSEWEYRDES